MHPLERRNDQGDEVGGPIVDGVPRDSGRRCAVGHLSVDQWKQNQVVALQYLDNGRSAPTRRRSSPPRTTRPALPRPVPPAAPRIPRALTLSAGGRRATPR